MTGWDGDGDEDSDREPRASGFLSPPLLLWVPGEGEMGVRSRCAPAEREGRGPDGVQRRRPGAEAAAAPEPPTPGPRAPGAHGRGSGREGEARAVLSDTATGLWVFLLRAGEKESWSSQTFLKMDASCTLTFYRSPIGIAPCSPNKEKLLANPEIMCLCLSRAESNTTAQDCAQKANLLSDGHR